MWLRYSDRISRFEYFASRRRAKISSLILRDQLRSDEMNALATCCVMVEPPCLTPPARKLVASARRRPRTSKPPCEKKRRSSVDSEGVDERLRHVIERHDLAPLRRQLGEQRAVLRPQRRHARRRRRVGRQIGQGRQLLAKVQVHAEPDERERRHQRAQAANAYSLTSQYTARRRTDWRSATRCMGMKSLLDEWLGATVGVGGPIMHLPATQISPTAQQR